MKSFRSLIVFLACLGIAGLAFWQQAKLQHLKVESSLLREQLAQALAKPKETNSMAKPLSDQSQQAGESPSSELLRLRGQVTVLREQLAEAVGSNSTQEAQSAAPALMAGNLAVAEADLKARQERAEVAQQKLTALMAALQLPSAVSDNDAAASLSAEDLRSYREAKQEAQEAERFVLVGKLLVARARAQSGDGLQPGLAK